MNEPETAIFGLLSKSRKFSLRSGRISSLSFLVLNALSSLASDRISSNKYDLINSRQWINRSLRISFLDGQKYGARRFTWRHWWTMILKMNSITSNWILKVSAFCYTQWIQIIFGKAKRKLIRQLRNRALSMFSTSNEWMSSSLQPPHALTDRDTYFTLFTHILGKQINLHPKFNG